MKLATVHCANPKCSTIWETVLDPGEWHAKCPVCSQEALVEATADGKEITGRCDSCKRPLDDHRRGVCP